MSIQSNSNTNTQTPSASSISSTTAGSSDVFFSSSTPITEQDRRAQQELDHAAVVLRDFHAKRNAFRDMVQQTLLIEPFGFQSLTTLIQRFIEDHHGFHPTERAKSLGYFSFLEFLKTPFMAEVARLDFQPDGGIHFHGKCTNPIQVELVEQIRISHIFGRSGRGPRRSHLDAIRSRRPPAHRPAPPTRPPAIPAVPAMAAPCPSTTPSTSQSTTTTTTMSAAVAPTAAPASATTMSAGGEHPQIFNASAPPQQPCFSSFLESIEERRVEEESDE